MTYDVALICKNGHLINSYYRKYPEDNSAFCPQCGASTVHECPHCQKEIKGRNTGECSYIFDYHIPAYCEFCGHPYPWTESALQNAKSLIFEEEELSESLKNSVIESLPDIITETPGTNLAVVRIKRCLASAGKFTADAVRQFVIDFGCELAKKSLGL